MKNKQTLAQKLACAIIASPALLSFVIAIIERLA